MPKTRTVPGVGDVEFPDDMSDAEVDTAVAGLKPSAVASKEHPVLDALDYVAAGARALGGLLGDMSGPDPIAAAASGVDTAKTAAGYMLKHPGPVGKTQGIVSAVPIVGAPIAALADPSIAVHEGRAPTHEENVSAVEGGAALAMLIAAPKIIGKTGKALARLRGKTAAATAPAFTADEMATPDPVATSDDDILAAASRRSGGRQAADVARQAIAEDQYRLSPQAALDREHLPVDDFVKQRFPKATINNDAGPEWVKGVLGGVEDGKPGLSVERTSPSTQRVAYRDPEGKPVAVATVVDGVDTTMVRDFATDKSQGLLASRAAGAVLRELDNMGVNDHFAEISPEAARFIQKAEAARAKGTLPGDGKTMHVDNSGIALEWPEKPTTFDPKTGLPEVSDPEFGQALRTLHTGERDARIADANNLAVDIRKALPDHVDREALTLMRDFRSKPGEMQAFLDGMHPAYDGMEADAKWETLGRMGKLRPTIERALNPSDAMRTADAALTNYFGKTLAEGKDLGFLGSNIAPEDYVNHLLLPADAETGGGPRIGPSGVNRYTPFAKKRFYPTVLDAVVGGAKVRTLDVADALSIYGDKHGTAAATHILIDTMKKGGIGKFGADSQMPVGWKEVGPSTRLFRNEVPYSDAEGNPQIAHQAFYAPEKVADALRPLTDPDYSSTIPGFTATKLYQQYVKSVELGLSVFHIRALNLSALGNEGITGLIKSYAADMASPQFREVEATLLKHGGTTSIAGRTFEAYRAARQTSLPTRLDVLRNLPVFKQFDQVSAATSHLTFDVMQRKFKVTDFAIKDAKWIAGHPDATPPQLAKARRAIAREINAVYGGLNWEALGVNKLTRSMSRAFFLAPDWTFSNWQNAKTAFTAGPGGAAARAFWLRSAAIGVGLTQLTSLLLSGKKSDDPTQVYLGQDHHGNDVYQNLFFAGAPSDMIGLVKNVQDYGAFEGTAHSVAAKLAPITRTGVQVLMNRNWMGQEIAKRGSGEGGDVRTIAHVATQLLPVPFSLTNMAQMESSNIASGQQPAPEQVKRIAKLLGDPTKDYTPTEFLTTFAGGTKPRHIPHWKRVREQMKK